MDSPHFLPRRKRCRRQADKSKCRFRKTPCLLCGEKRIAGDGEGSIGGMDEIKRRDNQHLRISLFADYSIYENSRLRFKYGYDWNRADDWTWNGFTYANGTTVDIPSKQVTHTIGIAFTHRF